MKESEINALRNEALHDQSKNEIPRPAKVYAEIARDCKALSDAKTVDIAIEVMLKDAALIKRLEAENAELKESNELMAKKVAELEALMPTPETRIRLHARADQIEVQLAQGTMTGESAFTQMRQLLPDKFPPIPQPPKGESQ